MDEIDENIFSSEDTLFHFTSFEAFCNIITSGQLRFSKVDKFSDPIEKTEHIYLETLPENNIVNFHSVNLVKNNMYVFSACSNITNLEDHKFTLYSGYCPGIKIAEWAIFKLRMWDQYADKQKGICLMFSSAKLNTILESQSVEIEKRNGNVFYVDDYFERTGRLARSFEFFIDKKEKGTNKTYEILKQSAFYSLYFKTIDYFSEGEYRIVLLPNSGEHGDYYYIDITEALIGVVAGISMNDNIRESVQTLIDKFNSRTNLSLELFKVNINAPSPPHFHISNSSDEIKFIQNAKPLNK